MKEDQQNLEAYCLAIEPAIEEEDGSAILPFRKLLSDHDSRLKIVRYATMSPKALHDFSVAVMSETNHEDIVGTYSYTAMLLGDILGKDDDTNRELGQWETGYTKFIRSYMYSQNIQVAVGNIYNDPFLNISTRRLKLDRVAPLMDAACLKSMVEYIKCSPSVTKIVIPPEIWATIVFPYLALMTIRDFWGSVNPHSYNNFDPLSIKIPELVYGEFQKEELSGGQQKYTEFLSLDGVDVSYSYVDSDVTSNHVF
ncbi:hypothetical protein [Candidatus Synchoanobacter obligatus]|uniref:Uncharacterized protein n=1 Tax=Candidatus Synchoanobacter obligatus TaxID=2919597 RepID=A0ABT1L5C8_9GAMM|nr:hypothetical protein [Candidatus Synchoanobacter obligatus]MCP8352385.1 hypothetical protein [Candidatus Synchoanobacter obligatus]